ncbi:MAG: DUF1573 domain-containing protein [Clostridium sp.]|nr:DUF1573 domain-containing protein [Clostridium sp.]
MWNRFILTLIVCMAVIGGHADNLVRIDTANGQPGATVRLTVNLEADVPVSAIEMRIPLDKNLTYVEESARLLPGASGHSLKATETDGELRLFVYSLSLSPLTGGDLLTFDLRLGTTGATYPLTPATVLSDAAGQPLAATNESGSVTILSAGISVSPATIDYGRRAIRSAYDQTFILRNTGTTDLHITGYDVSTSIIRVTPNSQTITPGETAVATVTYSPVERATSVSETIKVRSDATSGNHTVEVTAVPFSVNELHVGSAEDRADEEVTVSLTMNNMEPIVGGEISFRLPDALTFVEGSAECGSRASGHSVLSSVNGNLLKLVFYHPSNQAVDDNDGELLRFKLRLDGRTGHYPLTPETAILSNRQGENMTSAATAGSIRISSPRLSCPTTLSMGEGRVTDKLSGQFTVHNYGNAPLEIDRVTFLQEGFTVETPLPLFVGNYGSATLDVSYRNATAGTFATRMNLYTNDPDARMTAVEVNGRLYEPNQLTFNGTPDKDYSSYTLTAALDNYTDIVALQFDIDWLPGMTLSREDIRLTDRAANHTVSMADLGNGTTRIILLSMTNTPLPGQSGELLTMTFRGSGFVGHSVTIGNIVLSNRKGENMVSPSHQTVVHPVEALPLTGEATALVTTMNDGSQYALSITPSAPDAMNAVEVHTVNGKVVNADAHTLSWYVDTETGTIQTEERQYLSASEDNLNLSSKAYHWDWDGAVFSHADASRSFLYRHSHGFQSLPVTCIGTEEYSGYARRMSFTDGHIRTGLIRESWGSVCLPCAVDEADALGATFYPVAGKTTNGNGTVTGIVLSEPATMLQAGVPYVFRADSTLLVTAYHGEAVGTGTQTNGLCGTLEAINGHKDANDTQLSGKYMLVNNTWKLCGKGCSLAANRAYLDMAAVPVIEPDARAVILSVWSDHPTGIRDTDAAAAKVDVYTVSGMRVRSSVSAATATEGLQKGIYMISGKKILVK